MNKSKPLIGLTCSRIRNKSAGSIVGTTEAYTRAIVNAGGLPVLIPLQLSNGDLNQLADSLDAILFTGGYDIDPQLYGNSKHPRVQGVQADRDRTEISLVRLASLSGLPMMGICRGIQMLNVALGGSLYEDLDDQFYSQTIHDNHHLARNFLAHEVKIEPSSRLKVILGTDRLAVNSLHHQGVRRFAASLKTSARAEDGLIEACELPDHPFAIAVQWHPEEMQEHESMRRLFEAFVQACNR